MPEGENLSINIALMREIAPETVFMSASTEDGSRRPVYKDERYDVFEAMDLLSSIPDWANQEGVRRSLNGIGAMLGARFTDIVGTVFDPKTTINVLINSPGGDLKVIDNISLLANAVSDNGGQLQLTKRKLNTFVMDAACSAGAEMFLKGERRMALSNALLLWHLPRGLHLSAGQNEKLEGVDIEVERMRISESIRQNLLRFPEGLNKRELNDLITIFYGLQVNQDDLAIHFRAKLAKTYGLVTDIVWPRQMDKGFRKLPPDEIISRFTRLLNEKDS